MDLSGGAGRPSFRFHPGIGSLLQPSHLAFAAAAAVRHMLCCVVFALLTSVSSQKVLVDQCC
jgi:hypothetical protein